MFILKRQQQQQRSKKYRLRFRFRSNIKQPLIGGALLVDPPGGNPGAVDVGWRGVRDGRGRRQGLEQGGRRGVHQENQLLQRSALLEGE